MFVAKVLRAGSGGSRVNGARARTWSRTAAQICVRRSSGTYAPPVAAASVTDPVEPTRPFNQLGREDVAVLSHEAGLFDADIPVDKASTPPSSWFTHPLFYSLDKASLFEPQSVQPWQYVGPAAWVQAPRAFMTATLGNGDPVVIVRDDDGSLRAFYNVCAHHAAMVVTDETGTLPTACLRCPYHGWQYRLDGRLQKATKITGISNFRPRDNGLRPLAVEEFGPMLFVRPLTTAQQAAVAEEEAASRPQRDTAANRARAELAATADPVAPLSDVLSDLRGMLDRIGFEKEQLLHVKRRSYPLRCNFKVFIDNFLDGGYHVDVLHPRLAGQLDLASYETQVFPGYSTQTVRADESEAADGATGDGRLGEEAIYTFMHPNLCVNRYGPWLDTNLVIPRGPSHCEVVFDYFLDADMHGDDTAARERFVEESLEASDLVQLEDIYICESVQRGLESTAYETGRYAPGIEFADHAFHVMLGQDYKRTIATSPHARGKRTVHCSVCGEAGHNARRHKNDAAPTATAD